MPPLLEALLVNSDELRERAWLGIHDWQRRYAMQGWIRPSAACRADIERVWPRVRDSSDAPESAAREWAGLRRWIDEILDAGGAPL